MSSESSEFLSRRQRWQASPRPEWVEKINTEGRCMNLTSVVPLDAKSLIDQAVRNTGLSDFGNPNWYEPFNVLTRALDEEANLNLMGRLMTRSDLLLMLEARLMIEACYQQHPEIDAEEIRQPLFIIGQGRSGTSMLQNLLTADPRNKAVSAWEAYRPCPPPEAATYATDPRIDQYSALIGQINRVIPEIQSMHEFDPRLPTENIHLHCLSFMSPAWFGPFGGQVPSYNRYIQSIDPLEIYAYEKRVLKLLQWRNPRDHWVLKSPASIMHLPAILKVYPDVGFIWTHRDPVKALSSVVSLIGTLFWCRTDTPFIGDSLSQYTNADLSAALMNMPIDWLENGELPAGRLCNIHYQDLIKDPLGEISRLYEHYAIPLTDEARSAMQRYLDANPRTSRPSHHYSAGPDEQITRERSCYARYLDYFQVATEV